MFPLFCGPTAIDFNICCQIVLFLKEFLSGSVEVIKIF